jgi:WD40 repeat protein
MRVPLSNVVAVWLALLAVAGANAQQANGNAGPARTDCLGDLLPEGAVARFGTVRLWHGAEIVSIALSPDGKVVASGGGLRAQRTGLHGSALTVDGHVRLWNTASGKQIRALKADGAIGCLTFSPDGLLLAAGCGRDIVLWEVATGKVIHRYQGHKPRIISVAFSPDGRRLHSVAATVRPFTLPMPPDDTEVAWWDVASAKRVRLWRAAAAPANGDEGVVEALALSPDGRLLLKVRVRRDPRDLSKAPRTLLAYDMAAGTELYQQPLLYSQPPTKGPLRLSPDGKHFAWAAGDIWIGDPKTGKVLRKIATGQVDCKGMAFTPDGKRVAAVYLNDKVSLWDVDSGERVTTLERGTFAPGLPSYGTVVSNHPLAFSADGRPLAAGDGMTARLWNLQQGLELPGFPGHRGPVDLVRFGPSGRELVSKGGCSLCRWDVATGREIGRTATAALIRPWSFLDISPDGTATCLSDAKWPLREASVQLVALPTNTILCRLEGEPVVAVSGHFSPKGKALALITGAQDKILARVHDPATGKELGQVTLRENTKARDLWHMRFDHGYQAALSPAGKLLAWMEPGGRLQLFDPAADKVVRQLDQPPAGAAPNSDLRPYLLAFSPDGRQLASVCIRVERRPGAGDQVAAIALWDVPSGRLLRRLHVTGDGVTPAFLSCLAFSPDGRTLAVGSYGDARLRLLEISTDQVRRTLVGHQAPILGLAFAPDGRTLASASEDGTVLVWDLRGPLESPRP